MLDNFAFSLNAVTPIFLLMILGYILNKLGFFSKQTLKQMNNLVFTVTLPVMLFRDIANSDFSSLFDIKLVVYAIVTTLLTFFISLAYAVIFIKERKSIGSFVQGCFRSNYAIIGLPLIANILGDKNTGKGALITTFIVPLYNILAIIVLTIFVSENVDGKALLKSTMKSILKNPLLIGIFIGLPFSVFDVKLPSFAGTCVGYLSGITTPLALLVIGANVELGDFKKSMKLSSIATVFKLAIVPLVFIPAALLFGLKDESIVVLYVMYASPTAVSSFIMAEAMGNDSKLAANIVILTTIFSMFTFSIGVFALKTFNMI